MKSNALKNQIVRREILIHISFHKVDLCTVVGETKSRHFQFLRNVLSTSLIIFFIKINTHVSRLIAYSYQADKQRVLL